MPKSTFTAYIFWLLFGSHYAYLGRWGTQIIFWPLLLVGIGEIWWFIDLFRIPGLVARRNAQLLASRNVNSNTNVNTSSSTTTNNISVNFDASFFDQMEKAREQHEANTKAIAPSDD